MRNLRRMGAPGVAMMAALTGAISLLSLLCLPSPPAHAGTAPSTLTPGCSTATASAPALPVSPHFADVAGSPFDVETTANGRFTFVSSLGVGQPDHEGGGAVFVFRGDGADAKLVHTIDLGALGPSGMAFTDGGRILLVAGSNALLVLDVAAAERGPTGAIAWEVRAPGAGGIEVAPTRDGHFAFVTMEDSNQVDVFRLSGAHRPHFVGAAAVGEGPVGVALSPDGRTAYVTSEIARGAATDSSGTLSLLRVSVAERDPAAAVERTVVAGCEPVRVVVSADGHSVWVTARGSDDVLEFSARALARGAPALTSDIGVGAAPVGLAFFDGGRRLLVADSNRFEIGGTGSLAVLDVAGTPALVGYVPAGAFPRQMTLEPGGTELDVTNFDSSQLETVRVASLATGP